MSDRTKRLQLRPTTLGVKAVVFWCVIVAAWLATPYSNLFFLLLCFLSVLAPLSVLWTLTNLRGLDGRIDEIRPCAADSRGDILVQLGGSRRKAAHGLEVEVAVERSAKERRRERSGFLAEAQSGSLLTGRGPRRPRGLWRIQGAWLSSAAPLGLLRARRAIPCPRELAVHPEAAVLPEFRSRTALLAALRGEASPLDDGDFGPSGLREYRDGDEARHVDWRASARKTHLVVREWEADAARGVEICLDRRCDEDELEDALRIAVALLFLARDDKEVFALSTQGFSARFGDGQQPYDEALRYFASCEALPADAEAPPASSPDVLRLPSRHLAHACERAETAMEAR